MNQKKIDLFIGSNRTFRSRAEALKLVKLANEEMLEAVKIFFGEQLERIYDEKYAANDEPMPFVCVGDELLDYLRSRFLFCEVNEVVT